MSFAPEEKRELIQIARGTLEVYLRQRTFRDAIPQAEKLKEYGGAFVTLEKLGELRGCLGHLVADRPLYLTVQLMTIQSASADPRFAPVQWEEFSDLSIEISCISPSHTVTSLEEVRVGEHGLIVSRGSRRGLLLPQVAVREGWDRESFLSHTCRKAGLPIDDWKRPGMQFQIFTAEVINEKEVG